MSLENTPNVAISKWLQSVLSECSLPYHNKDAKTIEACHSMVYSLQLTLKVLKAKPDTQMNLHL